MFLRELRPYALEQIMNCDFTEEGVYSDRRQAVWENTLGYNYVMADSKTKKKMRNNFAHRLGTTPGCINIDMEAGLINYPKENSLACCNDDEPVTIYSFDALMGRKKITTEERKMNMYAQAPQAYAAASVQAPINPDADKIKHLTKRLDTIASKKERDALQAFGYNDDEAPKSPKELVERIKAGNFKFEGTRALTADGEWAADDDDYRGSPINYIEWRTKPADKEGYKAFSAALKVEKQKVEDTIKVLTPAEGLAALQAFESTTLH